MDEDGYYAEMAHLLDLKNSEAEEFWGKYFGSTILSGPRWVLTWLMARAKERCLVNFYNVISREIQEHLRGVMKRA
jgi:hypothetical protein